MGKIYLNLCMSIDGYIADIDGGYAWIKGQDDRTLDTVNKTDFAKFLEGIDVVVMGSKCYEQDMHKDFTTKEVYIASTRYHGEHDNIKFIKGDIVSIINKLKEQGKNIFLFGGGELVAPFIKKNTIDEYILGYTPVILGKGRRLFTDEFNTIELKLVEHLVEDGIIVNRYIRR